MKKHLILCSLDTSLLRDLSYQLWRKHKDEFYINPYNYFQYLVEIQDENEFRFLDKTLDTETLFERQYLVIVWHDKIVYDDIIQNRILSLSEQLIATEKIDNQNTMIYFLDSSDFRTSELATYLVKELNRKMMPSFRLSKIEFPNGLKIFRYDGMLK